MQLSEIALSLRADSKAHMARCKQLKAELRNGVFRSAKEEYRLRKRINACERAACDMIRTAVYLENYYKGGGQDGND